MSKFWNDSDRNSVMKLIPSWGDSIPLFIQLINVLSNTFFSTLTVQSSKGPKAENKKNDHHNGSSQFRCRLSGRFWTRAVFSWTSPYKVYDMCAITGKAEMCPCPPFAVFPPMLREFFVSIQLSSTLTVLSKYELENQIEILSRIILSAMFVANHSRDCKTVNTRILLAFLLPTLCSVAT